MIRQQEIRNPLLNLILMSTVPTYETALTDLCFHQESVQLGHHLFVCFEFFAGGGLGRESWEAELLFNLY